MNNNGLASYFQFKNVNWPNLWSAAFETIWMTIVSILIVAVFGLLLGLLLYETSGSNSKAVKALNWVVALFVNVFRSIPFIILIVLLLPVTQVRVGAITDWSKSHFTKSTAECLKQPNQWGPPNGSSFLKC